VLNYLLLYDQINKTGKENLQKVESSICSIVKQFDDFVVLFCFASTKEKIQMVEVQKNLLLQFIIYCFQSAQLPFALRPNKQNWKEKSSKSRIFNL
jgi:hypothetical protein